MRPAGVYDDRFRQLMIEDDVDNTARPEWGLRVELCWFVTMAARQYYQDLSVSATLEQFWAAYLALRL